MTGSYVEVLDEIENPFPPPGVDSQTLSRNPLTPVDDAFTAASSEGWEMVSHRIDYEESQDEQGPRGLGGRLPRPLAPVGRR